MYTIHYYRHNMRVWPIAFTSSSSFWSCFVVLPTSCFVHHQEMQRATSSTCVGSWCLAGRCRKKPLEVLKSKAQNMGFWTCLMLVKARVGFSNTQEKVHLWKKKLGLSPWTSDILMHFTKNGPAFWKGRITEDFVVPHHVRVNYHISTPWKRLK